MIVPMGRGPVVPLSGTPKSAGAACLAGVLGFTAGRIPGIVDVIAFVFSIIFTFYNYYYPALRAGPNYGAA